MDNINRHTNVNSYYLLNETNPRFVAIGKIIFKIKKRENVANSDILELISTT